MKREGEVLKEVRLALSRAGVVNFRNNRGKLKDDFGRWVEFGLCDGASDIIGWRSITITPELVGCQVAIFTAVETKRQGRTTASDSQLNFIARLQKAGGIAFLTNEARVAERMIELWRPERIIEKGSL